jgi:hypothetical protein
LRLDLYDVVFAKNEELAFCVCFRGWISFQKNTLTENVDISEITASYVAHEWNKVRFESRDVIFFWLLRFKLNVHIFIVKEVVYVDVELDVTAFYEINLFGMVALLIKNITD